MMNYRNAKYDEAGTITCEIEHELLGWIPITLSPDDEPTAAWFHEVVALGIAAPYVPPETEEPAP